MKSQSKNRSRTKDLRQRAEGQLRKSPVPVTSAKPPNAVELLHELEVHQVELELQNEELRRSHVALEESRNRYFNLYDLAPIGYVSVDRRARIKDVNLTGANLLWSERRRLIGQPFWRYVAIVDRVEFWRFCTSLFERGNWAEREIRLVPSGRAPIIAMLSGVAIDDGTGQRNLCQIAITDMSPLKRLEERERLAAIGQTAATLVEEISRPVNNLQRKIEFLARHLMTSADDSLQSTLGAAAADLSSLSALLCEFGELSGSERLSLAPVSVGALIEDVIEAVSVKFESQRIRIGLSIAAGLPQLLLDGAKIKQAILYLCKNAEAAMANGGTLTLRAYLADDEVVVEVSDTGAGIAKDLDLSEPFATSKTRGAGFGLMIVRQIVAMHRGFLSYASEPDKGTSFFLHFPTYPET